MTRVCGNIPIVLVGNRKLNGKDRFPRRGITLHKRKLNVLGYIEIDAQRGYGCEKPILMIEKELLG